jgi:hypothetical protein
MKRFLFILLVLCLLPTSESIVHARTIAPASFSAAQSLIATSSSLGNSYVAGASVVVTAPIAGDFLAVGGSVITAAPVAGDDFIIAGSIDSRARVSGDLRAAGWSVNVDEPVAGDLVVVGYSVRDIGRALGSVFIIAANVTLGGAGGPVMIYGNNIALSGDFAGDVQVVSSGHIALAPDTVIHGKLSYEAPEMATIPDSATIAGGVTYTNASYLPDAGTSRMLVFLSIGFFIIARIIGALILAGLLAGLFPKLAEAVIQRARSGRPRDILLALLLGFAILVATPIVIALLLLTFVGIGLALLTLVLYALLLLLAIMYSGILVGGLLVRRFVGREQILWHDGVLGMAVVSLIALVPIIGFFAALLLACFSAGTLLQMFFHFAFPHDERKR